MPIRFRTRAAVALCVLWLTGCGGEVPAATARHIVLVSLDALGARHVGAYGHEVDTTPYLDRLAAEGTLFEAAYTQQLWTLTSHLTMMTGLSPQAHGAGFQQPARPGIATLAKELSASGFTTAAFVGARGFMKPRYGLGRGFDTYETRSANEPMNNRQAFDWLRGQGKLSAGDPEHRFFLFLHYYDVHSDAGTEVPYDSPEPRRFMPPGVHWRHPGDTATLGALSRSGKATEEDRIALHALYDAGVYFTDKRAVGALMKVLVASGLAEETLLVVTSDHGDELFEHASISHQQPYDEGARVPLVMRGPGIPEGRRVDALVGLVDLMPTLLARAGVPFTGDIEGRDLSPLLSGDDAVRDAVFVDGIMTGYRHYPSAAIVDLPEGRMAWVGRVLAPPDEEPPRFVRQGAAELYDLEADPLQQKDLAAERPESLAAVERRILDWYESNAGRAAALGETAPEPVLSDEERDALRALGYGD